MSWVLFLVPFLAFLLRLLPQEDPVRAQVHLESPHLGALAARARREARQRPQRVESAPPVSRVIRSPGLRCVYCHDDVEGQVESCAGCGTVIHGDCLDELGRCPTPGCTRGHWTRRFAVGAAALLAPPEPTPTVHVGEQCVELERAEQLEIAELSWMDLDAPLPPRPPCVRCKCRVADAEPECGDCGQRYHERCAEEIGVCPARGCLRRWTPLTLAV